MYEWPQKIPNNLKRKKRDLKKDLQSQEKKILKLTADNLVPSLPTSNENLVIALQSWKKSVVELSKDNPTLLDFINTQFFIDCS